MNPIRQVEGFLKLKSGSSATFADVNASKELLVHDASTATLVVAMGAVGTAGTLLDYADKQETQLVTANTKLGTASTTLTVGLDAGATGIQGTLTSLWNLANAASPGGLHVVLNGTPITANSTLGAGGVGGIGWLSQLDYKLGAPTTWAQMQPGGVNLLGWLSQLARDSATFRDEQVTQHAEVRSAEKTIQFAISGYTPISSIRDLTTGSVTQVGGEYVLATTAATNSTATLNSVSRGNYQCGQTALAEFSVRVPTLPTGTQVAQWFYGDGTDGFGFGVDATGPYVWYQKGGGAQQITRQNAWSADKLNGTGASGYTLDLTKGAIPFIEFTWFGYGIVSWGVLAQLADGKQHRVVCHRFQTANGQSINNPNLHLGASVANGATSSTAFTLAVGGRSFSTWGEYSPPGRVVTEALNNYALGGTANVDQYVMAVRKKSAYQAIKVLLSEIDF